MKYFIELLQVAVGTRSKLSHVLSTEEWSSLIKEAQKQTAVGFMMDGLEKFPDYQRPPQVILFQWIGKVQMIETIYALQCESAKDLTKSFSDAGYPSCVLKGLGLLSITRNQHEGREVILTCGWMESEKE